MRTLRIGLGTLVALAVVVLAGEWVALRRGDIPYAVLERTYGNPQSRFVDLPGGVRLHVRDQGARDRATLLLLHGYSCRSTPGSRGSRGSVTDSGW